MDSVWQQKLSDRPRKHLRGNKRTEVLVIGGGMAGVLCAKALQDAGKDVILTEARQIGCGITARTTAVLTAQHDFLYQDMAATFGIQTAAAYLHANLDAVWQFRDLAKQISCDFEDTPSVQFTVREPGRLKKEIPLLKELGFEAKWHSTTPLPIPVAGAVEYPNMGQFHPIKFIKGAANNLEIYENSRVLQLCGTTARLKYGTVKADKVVVATHFPFINRAGLYFMKLYQNRSYVLALENAPKIPVTLAELAGQGIYFRPYGDLLLVGGGDHRTGKKGGGYEYLKAYAKQYFPDSPIKYAWANQDCMSLDGLPYVGRYSPHMPDVYVATGFNAWGMTNSMVAANLIRDLITGTENPLASVLRPNRSILRKQLFCNLAETVADFAIPTVKRCPHLGCALRWNPQEHSWDCPCHGSRFEKDGRLLDTPAQKDASV